LLAFVQGDYATATEALASSRPLLLAADDRLALALTEGVTGIITAALGEYEPGREQVERSLARFDELGDDWDARSPRTPSPGCRR
jgi:hypothetical protein